MAKNLGFTQSTLTGASGDFYMTGKVNHRDKVNDPLVVGYGRAVSVYMPPWLERQYAKIGRMIEVSMINWSGVENITVKTSEIPENTYTGQTYEYPVGVNNPNSGFNMTFVETQGSLIRRTIGYWFIGIGDPRTGESNFTNDHGAQFEYMERNFAGEMFFLMVRRDVNAARYANLSVIEEAFHYMGVYPKTYPLDHFKIDKGDQSAVTDMSLDFAGSMNFGHSIAIMNTAREQLLTTYKPINNRYFDPNLSSTAPNVGADLGDGLYYTEIDGVVSSAPENARDPYGNLVV